MEKRLPHMLVDLKATVERYAEFKRIPTLHSKFEKLCQNVRRIECKLKSKTNQIESCAEMLDGLLVTVKCVDKEIEKYLVEKFGTRLGHSNVENVLNHGVDGFTTRERIDAFYDYLAYLHGKVYGLDESDRFYPMLSEVSHTLRCIESKYMATITKENLWAWFYETLGLLENFEMEVKRHVSDPISVSSLKTILEKGVESLVGEKTIHDGGLE